MRTCISGVCIRHLGLGHFQLKPFLQRRGRRVGRLRLHHFQLQPLLHTMAHAIVSVAPRSLLVELERVHCTFATLCQLGPGDFSPQPLLHAVLDAVAVIELRLRHSR